VLVVEDDHTIREVLVTALEEEGYRVREAVHGRAALDLLEGWPADLIVLDLMLPVLDGWTFLAERRRLDRAASAPVVVVSASRQAVSGLSSDLGVAACLVKPFMLDALLDTVEQTLRSRDRRA
jgi:DNA-binding response OmpR family regulator